MLRFVKQIVWLAGIIIGCQSVFGFSLEGPAPTTANPADAFETPDIAYNLPIDVSVPKDIKEEYRVNYPVMYYAFDSSFLDYFGTNGAAEVDKAMAIYNAIGDVSAYSPELSEFPLDSRRYNYRAMTDGLWDLRSAVMGIMAEQLGFVEPARWVWALHARQHVTPGPPCPANMLYAVHKLNFSIVDVGLTNYPTSSYVNGVLYSYSIIETCNPPNPLADAVEFPVDPVTSPYNAVADLVSLNYQGLPFGGFYTALTRDDVGALRYLINTNNFNIEASGTRVTEFLTNNTPQAIQTFDLHVFAQQALTNSGTALAALYPGLNVTSDTNFFGLVITTNITETLVGSPMDPAGLAPTHPFFSTNYTTNFFNFFGHTFGNIVTNTFSTRGLVGNINLVLANTSPYAPAGTANVLNTNTTFAATPAFVPGVFGDFFILPTNLCGAQILSNLLTTVTATTNLPTLTTAVGVIGGAAGTNAVITFTPGGIDFATNHVVVYLPVTCPVDSVGVRGGMGMIKLIRRDYDSLLSQVWEPVTNDYQIPELDITNSVINMRHFQRRVPRPDFLFSCIDWAANNTWIYSNTLDGATVTLTTTLTGLGQSLYSRSMAFNSPNAPNLAGPGTIENGGPLPSIIVLNKKAPLFENASGALDEPSQATFVAWGTYDGTTNAPIVYPNGTSLQELEGAITGPNAVTRFLPNATVGASYSAQITATGAHPPFTFALAPGSAGLPDGLTLTPDGQISGTANGPAAIYDFTVRITDSATPPATHDVPFTITVF